MPIKSGNLFFESVSISDGRVRSGEVVTVTATVGNGALSVRENDPDACSNDANPCPPPGLFDTTGYCTEVEFAPTWSANSVADHACINIAISGIGRHTFQAEFTAPNVTAVTEMAIDATLRGASGLIEEEATDRLSLTVEPPPSGGNGVGACTGNADCPESHVCHNGDCVPGFMGIPRQQAIIVGSVASVGLGVILLTRDTDS